MDMINQAATLKEMMAKKRRDEYATLKEDRKNRQEVVGVASGKGGVGKTTLAVNVGILLAKRCKKVLIFDADLGLSNVNILLGVVPRYNLLHVFEGRKSLEEVICSTQYGVDIIAGGTGFSELANLTDGERMLLMQQMNALEGYDYIIIDVGAGVSENVTSFLKLADKVLVVTTPEPTAITDAYGMIKCLAVRSLRDKVHLVINRCRSIDEAKVVAQKIVSIAAKYLDISIEAMGMVFQDEGVYKALCKQRPYVAYDSHSKCYRSVEAITNRLIQTSEDTMATDKKLGFIGRLMQMF